MPTKTEEVSNLKTLPKGLSASLPDLDSENWIEVKKRPRPSPARPKVGGLWDLEELSRKAGWLRLMARVEVSSDRGKAGGSLSFFSEDHVSGQAPVVGVPEWHSSWEEILRLLAVVSQLSWCLALCLAPLKSVGLL